MVRTIGLVAAMPDEIRPLLKRVGSCRKGELAGYRRFDFTVGENSVVLVLSGMGPRRAGEATEALIKEVSPSLLVNFGFAGAVREDTKVGDLVLAREVLLLEGNRLTAQPPPEPGAAQAAAGSFPFPLREGSFITSALIEDKKRVAALLPQQVNHPVLEMETAAVLGAAQRAGVPVVAIRGISDGAGEELGFSLEEFCDQELQIRPLRVLGTVARKPWIIPQLLRLAADSRMAAHRLADFLELFLKG